MGFSTFPNNPFPPSTAQFDEGKNDSIQAEIDAIKDGESIDSFADVESALATKTNLSNIAPAFDATSGVYAEGDKIIYEGVLYEFTSAHSTAGEWDESEVQPVKVSELIDSLKSGLTDVSSKVTRIDNAPLYVTKTSDITLGSGASGTVSFTKSDFTIPSGYTADWSTCIYSVVGGWDIGCNSQAAFDSGEPHFTNSNSLLVHVTSNASAGNVIFRVAVSVKIIANQ